MPSDLILRVGLDSSSIKRQIATLNKTLNSQFSRLGGRLESIGKDLSLRVTAPIAAIGVASVRTFAQFDKLEKGLAAISGSTAEAQRQFGSMLDIVKDTRTTLDLKTATTTALQLQAVGRSAKSVENTLRQLGIAATLAGSSSDDVGEVGRQLSQAAAKGKILQQELRIILERIPSLAAVIKNEFGTVTAEGLREAGVSADEFINRLTRAIETNEKFQNVQGGISKAIETFGINLQIAGAELGKTISETIGLENALNSISNTISSLVTGFSNLSPSTKSLILGIGGIAASIGPLTFGLGVLIKTLPLLKVGLLALISPVGLIAAGLGLVAAAFIKYNTQIDVAAEAQKGVNNALQDARKLAENEANAVNKLVGVIKDENSTKGEKARAIEQLKRISPEYFGQLDVENIKTKELISSSNEYNTSLKKRQALQALNQRSLEVQERLAEVSEEINKSTGLGGRIFSALGGNLTGYASGVGQLAQESKVLKAELEALANEAQNVLSAKIDTGGTSTTNTTVEDVKTKVSQPKIDPLEGIGANATDIQALVQEVDRNIGLVNESISETGRIAETGFLNLVSADIKEFSDNIQTATNPLTVLGAAFEDIQEKSDVFGASFDTITEKINATKAAIQSALDEGFSPTSTAVEGLTEILSGLNTQLEAQQKVIENTKAVTDAYTNAFNSSVNSQVRGFGDIGRAALSAAGQVVKAKIQEATVNFIADAFAKFGVFGAIAAAGAGAIVGGVVSKAFSALSIPALAEGGITTGPTLALIGEGKENEVVLPLSKLDKFVNNSQPQERLIATVGIGELYIALERYKRENGRVN